MNERQSPEVERTRRSPAVVIVVSALYVVVKSLRRVKTGPVPVALRTAPPDTGFVIFRVNMKRKVRTFQIRCKMKRKQLKEGLTPLEDSLGRECDTAIALILAHVAAFDSVKRQDRMAAADSIRAEYERVKLKVRVFTRSGLGGGEVSDDSLDRELQKLISE
jgi:hypothetical protein